MTDQSVFENQDQNSGGAPTGTPEQGAPQNAPSGDVFSDQLKTILNERGEQKYDNLNKALDALKHSQEYIPQLKGELEAKNRELEQLRSAMSKMEQMEDIVAKLTESQTSQNTTEEALDAQKAAALFEQLMTQHQKSASAASNKQTVHNSLIERFGSAEAANKAVVEKATELGTTPEALGKLAEQSPKMVLAYFGGAQKEIKGESPSSSVNSEALLGRPQEEQGLKRPEKSLMAGASAKDQLEYFKQIREDVYKRFDVKS